jgi:hypothetical protein
MATVKLSSKTEIITIVKKNMDVNEHE